MDEDLKRIAARIRSWRDEAGLTLQKLGDRAGVSASTIHKIENLQTVPTIAVLLKVSNGLNRRPSELLEEVDGGNHVAILKHADRQNLTMSPYTKMEHLIAMIPRSQLDVWRVRIEAGRGVGRPGTDPWKFRGEFVILVEEGCIEAEIGGESYVAEAGDSMHFDASFSHRWIAGRGQPAKVIAFSLSPKNLHDDLMSRASAVTESEKEDDPEYDVLDEVTIEHGASS